MVAQTTSKLELLCDLVEFKVPLASTAFVTKPSTATDTSTVLIALDT